MRARIENWIRSARMSIGQAIMDFRDREAIVEIGTRHMKIIEELGWNLTNKIIRGEVRFVVENEDEFLLYLKAESAEIH